MALRTELLTADAIALFLILVPVLVLVLLLLLLSSRKFRKPSR